MINLAEVNIRLIAQEDTDDFFELMENNRDRLKRYFPVTISETEDYRSCVHYVEDKMALAQKKELYAFVVLLEEKVVGMFIVKNIDWRIPKCEFAYFIDWRFEGKGIMSWAMDLLLEHCFGTLGIHKIYICVAPENEPSRRLPLRKGFMLEGTHRQEFRIETGELVDIEYYGKLSTD